MGQPLDLLPCPFCGSRVHLRRSDEMDDLKGGIECSGCDIEFNTGYVSEEETARRWNKRIPTNIAPDYPDGPKEGTILACIQTRCCCNRLARVNWDSEIILAPLLERAAIHVPDVLGFPRDRAVVLPAGTTRKFERTSWMRIKDEICYIFTETEQQ